MQEMPALSFDSIHFPQRTTLIKRLRYISFVINDIVLVGALLIIGMAFTTTHVVSITPFACLLFLLSGIVLLFGAKRHLLAADDKEKNEFPWWATGIPILLASLTALGGLVNMFGVNSFFPLSPFEGWCFFLIGLALIPPFTRIPHRFHATQLFIAVVSVLNVFIFLENIHQTSFFSLGITIAFVLFCLGVLLRWSNRGFFGNFTLDSTGSMFGLRLFSLNLIVAPSIAVAMLLAMQHTSYTVYQVLAVIITAYTCISCFLLWVNVKLLYKYELEHLLMRESLRVHNIDLVADKETLRKRMVMLEQEKQHYLDKLKTQNVLQEAMDTLE